MPQNPSSSTLFKVTQFQLLKKVTQFQLHIFNVPVPATYFFMSQFPLLTPTVVEDTPVLSAAEMRPQNLVFSDISFMAILAGVTPSESDKVRQSALASESLTNNHP